mmetsp:Transcript_17870/g.49561  ORF Transcript_17870/g.49561 Transcript_17870/m.49561 type:complete len:204 (+) Transcript_17870:941-1552(+)
MVEGENAGSDQPPNEEEEGVEVADANRTQYRRGEEHLPTKARRGSEDDPCQRKDHRDDGGGDGIAVVARLVLVKARRDGDQHEDSAAKLRHHGDLCVGDLCSGNIDGAVVALLRVVPLAGGRGRWVSLPAGPVFADVILWRGAHLDTVKIVFVAVGLHHVGGVLDPMYCIVFYEDGRVWCSVWSCVALRCVAVRFDVLRCVLR